MANYFITQGDGFPHIDVDQDSRPRFGIDWSSWCTKRGSLGISSVVVIPPTGVTLVGAYALLLNKVYQSFSIDTPLVATSFSVVFRITTLDSPAMVEDQTIVFDIVPK